MVTLFDTYSQDPEFKRLSVLVHEMTLNKSLLMAKLSRITHAYLSNPSSISTLDGRDADTAVCQKEKTIETGCMWIRTTTVADSNGR